MNTHIVVGGQFGSEAKGHVAAALAHQLHLESGRAPAVIRVGGPNAGHSVMDAKGQVFAFRTLPVTTVTQDGPLIIGPGSEIDLPVLYDEIRLAEDAGYPVRNRLYVDEQATIIEPIHKQQEADSELNRRVGSTAKGIGAARAERLMRTADIAKHIKENIEQMSGAIVCDTRDILGRGIDVIIEGTQGYGLGLHAGFYPFCTAGDCRGVDFLAQSGQAPKGAMDVVTWVVFRTYPIRVAGNSGPMNDETSWEALNAASGGYITEERTTVTKKVRRVGAWDPLLARAAMRANGGPSYRVRPVLTFVDYLDPGLAGSCDLQQILDSSAGPRILNMERDINAAFSLFTTGAGTHAWVDQ